MQRRGFVLSALAAALASTMPAVAQAPLPLVDPLYFQPVHDWLIKERLMGPISSQDDYTISYWARVRFTVGDAPAQTLSLPCDNHWHQVTLTNEAAYLDGIRVQRPQLDLQLRERAGNVFLDDLRVVKRGKNLA